LKNGVGRFNIFFFIFTRILLNPSIFLFITCAFFSKQFRTMRKRFIERGRCVCHQWSYDHIHEYMNIMLVNIEFFTGHKKIKQRHISFVPGYKYV
jgi:hypothetical protein